MKKIITTAVLATALIGARVQTAEAHGGCVAGAVFGGIVAGAIRTRCKPPLQAAAADRHAQLHRRRSDTTTLTTDVTIPLLNPHTEPHREKTARLSTNRPDEDDGFRRVR